MIISTTYLNIVPLRAEPSHRSEMVSQVLYGEALETFEEENDFTRVRMIDADYPGWIQTVQLVKCDHAYTADYHIVGLEEVSISRAGGDQQTKLYHSTKPLLSDIERGIVRGRLRMPTLQDFGLEFPKLVKTYLHTPYLWGGRSIAGIDCSGLSQAFYAHFGVLLKRDAYQQAEMGEVVDFLQEIKPGDLAFFDNKEGKIIHVGIMIDTDTIIHASGEVRIDKMDQEGIFNNTLNKYSHKLRIVKRFF